MTIEITVMCDYLGCDNKAELDHVSESELEAVDFILLPDTDDEHYCEVCADKLREICEL
jgi:hypothetical protein